MPDVLDRSTQIRGLWHRALSDPCLQDVPYKVETNAQGQLLLSPHKPQHSFTQVRLTDLLDEHAPENGQRAVEFAVETPEGVKVPDVVWMSDERIAQIPEEAEASPLVPELCIEVLSAGNTRQEMAGKVKLYLDGGAREVWLVSADGTVAFYGKSGPTEASAIAPSFPQKI